jgi:hypothetical protein
VQLQVKVGADAEACSEKFQNRNLAPKKEGGSGAEFCKILALVLFDVGSAQYHIMLKVSGKTRQFDAPHTMFTGLA